MLSLAVAVMSESTPGPRDVCPGINGMRVSSTTNCTKIRTVLGALSRILCCFIFFPFLVFVSLFFLYFVYIFSIYISFTTFPFLFFGLGFFCILFLLLFFFLDSLWPSQIVRVVSSLRLNISSCDNFYL